jgi:SH3-like domain-containing protein
MAVPFRAVVRSGVVVFAGLGAGAAFMIMGIAGVALRSQCPEGAPGLSSCVGESFDPVTTGSTEPEFEAETIMAMQRPEVAFDPSPVSARAVDLAKAGGMIAATFDMLVDPNRVTATAPKMEVAEASAETSASAEAAPSTTVAKRVVRSVKINAEGDPVWPVTAYAEAMDRVDVASTSAAAAIEAEVKDATTTPVAETGSTAVAWLEPAARTPAAAAIEPLALAEPAEAPAATVAEPSRQLVTVQGGVTNVRAGPSRDHKRLFTLPEGAEVEALAATQNWIRVIDSDGRAGWIWSEYLAGLDLDALPAPPPEAEAEVAVAAAPEVPEPKAEPEVVQTASIAPEEEVAVAPMPASRKNVASASAGDVRTVKGQGVNVRSGPSSSAGKLFALVGGTEVTVTDTQKGWLKVTDSRGRTGWAYKTYLN